MSKGIDVNKTDGSHKFNICNYLYFLGWHGLEFDPKIYNSFQELMQKAMIFNNVTIASVKKIYFWKLLRKC